MLKECSLRRRVEQGVDVLMPEVFGRLCSLTGHDAVGPTPPNSMLNSRLVLMELHALFLWGRRLLVDEHGRCGQEPTSDSSCSASSSSAQHEPHAARFPIRPTKILRLEIRHTEGMVQPRGYLCRRCCVPLRFGDQLRRSEEAFFGRSCHSHGDQQSTPRLRLVPRRRDVQLSLSAATSVVPMLRSPSSLSVVLFLKRVWQANVQLLPIPTEAKKLSNQRLLLWHDCPVRTLHKPEEKHEDDARPTHCCTPPHLLPTKKLLTQPVQARHLSNRRPAPLVLSASCQARNPCTMLQPSSHILRA